MAEVKLNIQQGEPSSFDIFDEDGKVGEMIFDITGKDLTVYHTEVEPEKEGMGYAKMLLDAMVAYVRKNGLMIIPMCPYVHAQFKRHEDLYKDIWNKIKEE
ncbi:GNAT family N-acetyltransferase [Pedobacter sp. MC2016-05]|uniref:GNAT family N-acetyltransferase n=1 Tax=Pedobacter sp. MC2016-05 TaxID=2994474 RepID=UPI002246762E|nr:GNAT family N-acetyltransferase [Pedobacter sp. MC2016-05]MCX2475826.1 GNAT family N-acetyltransferase [Pedobacter sp. MC2016-05]